MGPPFFRSFALSPLDGASVREAHCEQASTAVREAHCAQATVEARTRHWLCARWHFLCRRASSGHNNSFYAGPRGQWLSDRWQTHVPVFSVDVSPCDGLTYKYFHPRVILYVRTSIRTWLTNSIRQVTKLLMPKLNN